MDDADREPRVSDDEILAVFARREGAFLPREVAEALPAEADELGDRLDGLYERGLLDTEETTRGTEWRLVPEAVADADVTIPDEQRVESDVEAQASTEAGAETSTRHQETPSSSPQSPPGEPLGDYYDPQAEEDDAAAETIEAFDPPGTAEERDLRREALRAAYAYLRKRGTARREDIESDVFAEWPAGYDDVDDWWEEVVRPGLSELPAVESPDEEGDGAWRHLGDDAGRA